MKNAKEQMYILSLEAKDIFIAMADDPNVGYKIPTNNDGKVSLSKFTNTLDWSLDRDKLEEVYKSNLKSKDKQNSKCKQNSKGMTFEIDGKVCTQAVINVDFSLGLNEFNKFYNTYVRIGYSYKDCKFTDGICINDDILIAIKTDVNIKEPVQYEYLGEYFEYDVEKGKYRNTSKKIPKVKSADDFYCVNKNTYIRYGYTLKDCNITDGICIDEDGKLLAIQIGVDIKEPRFDILGETFNYSKKKHQYHVSRNHNGVWNIKKLREYLYENGFVCDGIKYVRYKRSAGSAREGKCLFVDESLAERMTEWDSCGLILTQDRLFDLASWEAYIALTMSGMIDTIDIKPENILLVADYKDRFSSNDDIAVYNLRGNIEDNELGACRADVDVENKIWDGESLLDSSIFAGKYKDKGMLVLRNRFFKTCAFNTNIQKWFEDNNITNVEQLNGLTRAADITQIKLITTPSSLKYLKFEYEWNYWVDKNVREKYEKKYSDGSAMFQYWLDKIKNSSFGIVKYEKQPPFFDGRLVQSHYQLLNTLHLTEGKLEELLAPSIEYLCAFRRDPAVMRYHIIKSCKPEKDDDYEEEFDYEDSELDDSDDTSAEDNNDTEYDNIKYEIISELLDINVNFSKTKLYKQFRNDIVESFKKRLREGRILLNGNYSTLFGNGIELLQYSINKKNKYFDVKSIINPGTIYTKRFAPGAKILGSRSPHITMGNILIATNATSEESKTIDKYFNLTEEIVYITSIGDNILNRLNGADFDSDTMLLTDNEILIRAAEENNNYRRFGVPNSSFPNKDAQPRLYNEKSKAELDDMLKNGKVGRITNLSQALNSLYWDRINNGEDPDSPRSDELYFDICKLAVLSGYEIDRAKKDLPGDSNKVLEILKNKYLVDENNRIIKPMFFEMLAKNKGIQTGKNTVYKEFKTSMDYLQKAVKRINFTNSEFKEDEKKGIDFKELLIKPNNENRHYKKKLDEIIKIIRDCNNEIKKEMSGYYRKSKSDKQATRRAVTKLKLKCIKDVDSKANNNEYLLCKVLEGLDKKENNDIRSLMFEILLKKRDTVKTVQKTGARKKAFRDVIERVGKIDELYIDDDSNSGVSYYGIKFSRR